jgi:hypothetical protein
VTALVTLPALMHDVHTFNRFGEPLTNARTRWMFGSQRRLVRRWEWLTFIPNEGCLPQISHTEAIGQAGYHSPTFAGTSGATPVGLSGQAPVQFVQKRHYGDPWIDVGRCSIHSWGDRRR